MHGKTFLAVFSFAVLLAAAPASADTGTRSVDTEVRISAGPDEVLQAFLDGDDLQAWWKVSRTLVEPKTGGIWSITWDNWGPEKTQHAWSGVIEEITANRLVIGHLVMNEPDLPLFGPLRLEISVAPAAGGTLLLLSHSGYGYGEHWDEMYDLVVQGWDHVLGDMETWFRAEY